LSSPYHAHAHSIKNRAEPSESPLEQRKTSGGSGVREERQPRSLNINRWLVFFMLAPPADGRTPWGAAGEARIDRMQHRYLGVVSEAEGDRLFGNERTAAGERRAQAMHCVAETFQQRSRVVPIVDLMP
jgi:hypothetical protein